MIRPSRPAGSSQTLAGRSAHRWFMLVCNWVLIKSVSGAHVIVCFSGAVPCVSVVCNWVLSMLWVLCQGWGSEWTGYSVIAVWGMPLKVPSFCCCRSFCVTKGRNSPGFGLAQKFIELVAALITVSSFSFCFFFPIFCVFICRYLKKQQHFFMSWAESSFVSHHNYIHGE